VSTEVRTYQFTIPAGTAIATPQTMDLSFPPRNVEEIHLVFPPGPMGAVGVAIGAAGQPVIPYNAGAWIIADDDTVKWPVVGAHNSGSWEAFGYNLGNFPHTIGIRFLLTTLDEPAEAGSLTLVSADVLSNATIGM
jgi:hypothetical protein